MSEQIGNDQPIKKDDTQPLKPVKKTPRWRSILISVLGVIVLLGLGGLGGYGSGIGERKAAQSKAINQQLMEQFQYALVDEQFGRYEAAQERLQFIIENDPGFPGAQALFATAQQVVAAGDWINALAALDQLRKQDPAFNTSQVDGMYYFALRNYGVSLIQKQGDLEGGIYQLTLAERFAPLDRDANGLREGARLYIQAASFYGINWKQSVQLWSQVASGWPALWDGTMNASRRYWFSLMRYGDQLFGENQFCDAWQQYQAAQAINSLDQTAAKNANQAYVQCYPPTEVPTDTPPALPTETPSETPTP